MPRTVDVELTEDLVDYCVPGDVVTVAGIVRATKCEATGRANQRTLYQLYIKANSITHIGKTTKDDHDNLDDYNKDEDDENSKLGVVEFTDKDSGLF